MNSSSPSPPPHLGTVQDNTSPTNTPFVLITKSQVDASVDGSIHKEHNEEDHDPVIITLPDPRIKVATSNDDNTASKENNEVDFQESTGDALDGAEDTLLGQPQMTTRFKSCSDNKTGTAVEP